jgi:hypothetical protein
VLAVDDETREARHLVVVAGGDAVEVAHERSERTRWRALVATVPARTFRR